MRRYTDDELASMNSKEFVLDILQNELAKRNNPYTAAAVKLREAIREVKTEMIQEKTLITDIYDALARYDSAMDNKDTIDPEYNAGAALYDDIAELTGKRTNEMRKTSA